jgi:hypothetical protein
MVWRLIFVGILRPDDFGWIGIVSPSATTPERDLLIGLQLLLSSLIADLLLGLGRSVKTTAEDVIAVVTPLE